MQARIYISLQGPSFDPRQFHARWSNEISGGIRHRKHSGAPLTNVPKDYWVTSEVTAEPEDVAAVLSGLLVPIIPSVKGHPGSSEIQVTAHIVLEFQSGEDPVGFHFPQQVIDQLNMIRAALDIDAVPRIRQATSSR